MAMKHSVSLLAVLAISACLFLVGCPVPGGIPLAAVSPEALDFGTEQARGTFQVWNAGTQGSSLVFSVAEHPDWVTCTPMLGSSSGPSDLQDVLVTVDRSGLAPGDHTGTILIDSNANEVTIDVAIAVDSEPPNVTAGYVYEMGTFSALQGVTVECAGVSTVTNTQGYFALSEIAPGMQAITAWKTGFEYHTITMAVREGTNPVDFYITRLAYAGSIRCGETLTGRLDLPSETDAYTFYGEAGKTVLIHATEDGRSVALEPAVYLFAPSGVIEVEDWDYTSAVLEHRLRETGWYTIVVHDAQGDDTGNYGVSLLLVPDTTTLPQDGDGGVITSAESRRGGLDPIADTDAFTFYAEAGLLALIRATETPESVALEPALRLVAPSGLIEAEDWDYASAVLEHRLQETGWYTVVVNDNQSDDIGDYGLSLLLVPGFTTSPEDMDGGVITSAETVTGTLNPVADTDAFKFYGETDQVLFIRATEAPQSVALEPMISLLGPSGLIEVEDWDYTSAVFVHRLEETGWYTIVVNDDQGNDTGEYGMSVLLVPGATVSLQDVDGGAIMSGQAIMGTLSPVADTDAFTFNGSAGQVVTIRYSEAPGSVALEPSVYLFAPSGLIEAQKWDYTTAEIVHRLQETGVYTIVVNDDHGDDTGDYGLSLLIVPG